MSCVLSHAAHTSVQEEASSKIPPLFITFRCGYCPKGVFSALIVHLMSKHNNGGAKITWRLKDEVDNVQGWARGQCCVYIITHATHLEVFVQSETETQASVAVLQTSPHEVCNSIRQCIDEGIVAVSQTLHYSCDSAFHYSFYCTHPSCTKPHDHLAACYSEDPIVMECSKRQSFDLPDNYRICMVWTSGGYILGSCITQWMQIAECCTIFWFRLTFFFPVCRCQIEQTVEMVMKSKHNLVGI